MYYVYFLQDALSGIYYGRTNDLKRWLAEHNRGQTYYTRGRKWRLVYYEAYLAETDARQREKQLKRHGQALAKVKLRIANSLRQNSAG